MRQPLPAFVEANRPTWEELDAVVADARGRVDRLDPPTVHRLGRLYRTAVADLAYARRCYPRDPVTERLDASVRRARPLVYGSVRERGSVRHFATTGFWQRVRERPVFLLVAAVALFAPTIGVALWAHGSPDDAVRLAEISPLTSGIAEDGPRDPDEIEIDAGTSTAFSAQIFTNNARVALIAYAGGLTGGLLTLASLVFNGLVLGLVGGLAVQGGFGDSLWRLVVPHGVLELSLIVVAGAAGLRTGWALLRPGHRTRTEALAIEGRAGVEMALGAAFLLVPCGLIEGYVTPRGLSLEAALAVGFSLGAAFWALVVWRGRPDRADDPA
jgi:uncharacterized membrane protein SpoIIM required for sporulation